MVKDKFQVRSTGPVDSITQQPVKGRKAGGGIRFGEMERDSLLAHGVSFYLLDRLFHSSDEREVELFFFLFFFSFASLFFDYSIYCCVLFPVLVFVFVSLFSSMLFHFLSSFNISTNDSDRSLLVKHVEVSTPLSTIENRCHIVNDVSYAPFVRAAIFVAFAYRTFSAI